LSTLLLGAASTLVLMIPVRAQDIKIKSKYGKGDFRLVYRNEVADILTTGDDLKVVQIAANDLASDIARVTGKRPNRTEQVARHSENVVIIGTLGKSAIVNDLARRKKIDVSAIQNKRESFLIATVQDPLPNVRSALVIAGSDRRGTAYGVYDLSQSIGVSPWYWWADVVPERKTDLIVAAGSVVRGEPSVRYRGIFLNDEDWGLQPWAAKTFEPEVGDIGPKTYRKIFELLLRLKANTLWPAMHEVTRPFNSIPENCQIADDYAIHYGLITCGAHA
jgi:hypothetical protein